MNAVLVVNCGSSSLKYAVFDMATKAPLATGVIDRIGEEAGVHLHRRHAPFTPSESRSQFVAADHGMAIHRMIQTLTEEDGLTPRAVGHRVVHGGAGFSAPTRLNEESLVAIRRTLPLAPLHNPINLAGIETCLARFPDLPQVAVFDTAFHQTMPEVAWRYALPRAWHDDWGVRRYGFHGTSHAYVAARAAEQLGRALDTCNLITLHLGNGTSAAAILNGQCVDTSMGMTPLEGLVMGTRCGDMDPAIPAFMARMTGLSPEQVDDSLNRHSGLKALCGEYDMRVILARVEAGDADAELALDMYCYRIRKYLGAYAAVLGRVDAVVFTGGIGEHAAPVRARICAGLDILGLAIDAEANAGAAGRDTAIHQAGAPVALLVIATNEELEIARQTVACIAA